MSETARANKASVPTTSVSSMAAPAPCPPVSWRATLWEADLQPPCGPPVPLQVAGRAAGVRGQLHRPVRRAVRGHLPAQPQRRHGGPLRVLLTAGKGAVLAWVIAVSLWGFLGMSVGVGEGWAEPERSSRNGPKVVTSPSPSGV